MTRRYGRFLLAVAPRLLATLMLVAMLVPGAAASAATPAPAGPQVAGVNPILDGGFEEGAATTSWIASRHSEESDDPITTPICDIACAGQNLARTGNWFALFGLAPWPVESAITQSVTIPSDLTDLTFWVWMPASSGDAVDTLSVLVDGHQVWQTNALSTTYAITYTLAKVDLSTYANGQPHNIVFDSTTNGLGPGTGDPTKPPITVFTVDDVSLVHLFRQYIPIQSAGQQ